MVLIESDPERRTYLADGLRAIGIPVVAVGCIAEIERWPSGDVVVTDFDSFSPWWKHIGVVHVVVLADTPAQGVEACGRDATAWVLRTCTLDDLLSTLRGLLPGTPSATPC